MRRSTRSRSCSPLARWAAWLAVMAGLIAGGCGGGDEPKTNVLFLVVDTLRADHLGVHGYSRNTSPRIDRLAGAGVRFADATPQWPKTLPSMASMLTGAYPLTTGVRLDTMVRRNEALPLLPETLRQAGYQTGAVVANFNVGRRFAFEKGSDIFVESWMEEVLRRTGQKKFTNAPGKVKRYTNATVVTDQALEVVSTFEESRPFFLWLHYMDPHGPYVPPAKYRELFRDDAPPRIVPLDRIPEYQRLTNPEGETIRDLAVYVRQYDRSIRHLDDEIARLLDTLERDGWLDDTLIVFTSDHGESLTENGYFLEHGAAPYQPTAHVPLFFVKPGLLPRGKVVDMPVGLIDIYPTVMEILEVPAPSTLQGSSLLEVMRGEEDPARFVFMEGGESDRAQRAVRNGPWKLVHMTSEADRRRFDASEFELFHLARDPFEETDEVASNPQVARDLQEALLRWHRETPRGKGAGSLPEADEEAKALLRALGYIKD